MNNKIGKLLELKLWHYMWDTRISEKVYSSAHKNLVQTTHLTNGGLWLTIAWEIEEEARGNED